MITENEISIARKCIDIALAKGAGAVRLSMNKCVSDSVSILNGEIDKVFTTNLVYRTPELLTREWYKEVNMCKYVAYIIDTLNHDKSVSKLLDPAEKIDVLLKKAGIK